MTAMVELDRLTRRFGPLLAVDQLSFALHRGEVLGFLGPNGAGKTTTMRMLAGFLQPSGGSARIMGHDVVHDTIPARRALGYLPEGAPLYPEMTPLGLLHFVAAARGMGDAEAMIRTAVARTRIEDVAHRPIETLSKGFKRRVGLAAAILHDPPVLILDEPTDGLDPNQKREVRRLIQDMAADKAIIVSTHILEEVPAVCTRAIIIAHGRIVADATPGELASRSGYTNAVAVRAREEAIMQLGFALDGHPAIRDQEMTRLLEGRAELLIVPAGPEPIADLVRETIGTQGIEVEEFRIERGRLDDVFTALTTGPDLEAA